MEINISDIPDFLRDSEFYKNLDSNNEDVITIPKLKMDDEVNNIFDFKDLFKTLNFFLSNKFPKNFIKYYQNNSQEVFDSLDHEIYQELLIDLCNLKIKNTTQFFITYKIITLYKLQDYDNYINYALNNKNIIYVDYIFNKSTQIYNEEYINLSKKIGSTDFLTLKPYIFQNLSNNIHLKVKTRKLSKKWKYSKTILPLESIIKIIEAIKKDYEYEYNSFDKNNISYKNNEIYITSKDKYNFIKNTIKINEFNKKIILKNFEIIIEWIKLNNIPG
uniref:Uncharacterized protein n=1 Tax=viral metagenome TaxID=1070528 RepID=A0A6C0AE16_9ZZZZ